MLNLTLPLLSPCSHCEVCNWPAKAIEQTGGGLNFEGGTWGTPKWKLKWEPGEGQSGSRVWHPQIAKVKTEAGARGTLKWKSKQAPGGHKSGS